ncbi:hypothetical protein [Rhabdothermincola sp.]|uniref:hypothetical protein n=1 Tax=Rhabdothermincola sp. TaxID=2820405 RepID=UPI002FE1D6E4
MRQDPADTPLVTVMDNLDASGYRSQFQARDGGLILCFTCRVEFAAARAEADLIFRLEGASDVADMVTVVPLTCPVCGAAGTLVLHSGPDASPEEAEVLSHLERSQPSEGEAALRPMVEHALDESATDALAPRHNRRSGAQA